MREIDQDPEPRIYNGDGAKIRCMLISNIAGKHDKSTLYFPTFLRNFKKYDKDTKINL